MSDDGSSNFVRSKILKLLESMDENELNNVEHWITSHSYKNDLKKSKSLQKSVRALSKIGKALKQMIPFDAQFSSEVITMPTVGDQADCTVTNSCHIDEFLYDDDEVEKLVKKGKLHRNYCVDCGSRNIKPLTFLSHSMSIKALQYVFKVLLPQDLEGKQILDIGSRIGAVLYGAYHLTNATSIIGVEMNKECCDIQNSIIKQFSIDNNILKVVHSDILDCTDIIQTSDVIIVNVLDFFVDVEKHKEMWIFFKKTFKKGVYLVTNRSMLETLSYLELQEEFTDWLSICKPFQIENELLIDIDDFDYSETYLYCVN